MTEVSYVLGCSILLRISQAILFPWSQFWHITLGFCLCFCDMKADSPCQVLYSKARQFIYIGIALKYTCLNYDRKQMQVKLFLN